MPPKVQARPASGKRRASTTPALEIGLPVTQLHIIEVGGPRRSRSAPTRGATSPGGHGHVNAVRALRRAQSPTGESSDSLDGTSPDGSPRQKPNAHQRVYSTWNKLQMGDQSNFLHQHARSIEGVLSPKANRPKNTGPWQVEELDSIVVEDTYAGPRLLWPFGLAEVMELVHFYKKDINAVLHRRYAIHILLQAKQLLSQKVTSALVEYTLKPGQVLTICGDTHGQLQDVLWIFHLHGYPSEKNVYLFNGDIADRGENATQIFLILFAMMLVFPDSILINRGNHEDCEMNELPLFAGGGFAKEVRRKYGGRTFSLFQEVFDCLPLAMVFNSELLVVHGGLPRHVGVRLEHIRNIDFRTQPPVPDSYPHSIFFDLLWSDPKLGDGVGPSRRGPFCVNFGPDITARFLDDNGLAVCVRSHEVPTSMRGFDLKHNNRLLTVFSASNYCGSTGNYGAVARFRIKDKDRPEGDDGSPGTLRIGTPDDNFTTMSPGPSPRGKGAAQHGRGGGRGVGHHLPPLPAATRLGVGLMRPMSLPGAPAMAPIAQQRLSLPRLQGLECTIHEHWAPPLSDLPNEASELLMESMEQQRLAAERAATSTPRGQQKMKFEILEKARARILERRQELMWHYLHLDSGESARITLQQWQEGLEAVLQLDIPWMEYCQDLVTVEEDGGVDYRRFLHRFRIGVPPGGGAQWSSLQDSRLLAALVQADLSVEEAVGLFRDELTMGVLGPILERAGPLAAGITLEHVAEVVATVRAMGSDAKVALPPHELVALFVVMFDRAEEASPVALPFPSDFLKTFQSSRRNCVQLFQEFDTRNAGRLSYNDFMQGMRSAWSQLRRREAKLETCQSEEQLAALATSLDPQGRGHICVLPFCRAFYAKQGPIAADSIMQQLYTLLYENAVTLRRACRFYDDTESGAVSVQEFKEALAALNTLLFKQGTPFSPLHIAIIAAHAGRGEKGAVRYVEFFDSFAVVDAEDEPTTPGGRAPDRRASVGSEHSTLSPTSPTQR